MTMNPSRLVRRFPSFSSLRTAAVRHLAGSDWNSAWMAAASLCLAACAAMPPARMALAPGLEAAMPLPFEGLGAARSGRFTLQGQVVTFRRKADSLSLLDKLKLDRVSVEFDHPEARGRCDGRATGVTVGIVDTPVRPLTLNCRFAGRVAGELHLLEPKMAGAKGRRREPT